MSLSPPDPLPPLSVNPLRASEHLHARVRRFAERAARPPLVVPKDADTFDELALAIAQYQQENCPGFARLVSTGTGVTDVASIPAVTAETFRMTRVAAHPQELDSARFLTSGTTGQPGRHPMRDLSTYDHLALLAGAQALFARSRRGLVIALASAPTQPETSSLTHMMRLFMEHFDGRAITRDPRGAPFSSLSPERWLIEQGTVQLDRLRRAAKIARERSEPLFLLATSFALAAALTELDGEVIKTPRGSCIMLTGGFKGRQTSLNQETLRQTATRAFALAPDHILGEYGMTELTSQLYEAWPRQSEDASRSVLFQGSSREGLFFAPPWLRVTAVDGVTHERVDEGTPGLARFVDLGNVDSAVAVITDDRIREIDGGIELLGRQALAVPRGCSLPYEGLLAQSHGTEASR